MIKTFRELKDLHPVCPICSGNLLFSSEEDRHIENMTDDEENFYYWYCPVKSSNVKQFRDRPEHLGHYSIMYDYHSDPGYKFNGGWYYIGADNYFVGDYFTTRMRNPFRLDVDQFNHQSQCWEFSFSSDYDVCFTTEEKFAEDLANHKVLI